MDTRTHDEPPPRRRSEENYRNVNDRERKASLIAGLASVLLGLRRGGAFGLALGAFGGLLGYRGATGHCPVFATMGKSTARPADRGLFAGEPLRITTGVTINREPRELYLFWRDFTELPKFMKFITEVRTISEQRTRWVAESPLGGKLEWESEVVEDIPNERIVWRATEHSKIKQHGEVRFRSAAGGRGTEVELDLRYELPAGTLSRTLAGFVNSLTEQAIREDLRRFKRLMEAHEIPTNAVTSIASRQGGPQ